MVWERTYAEIAQNCSQPPKIAEHPTVERSEPPGQLWCVPGSEHYLKTHSYFIYTSSARGALR